MYRRDFLFSPGNYYFEDPWISYGNYVENENVIYGGSSFLMNGKHRVTGSKVFIRNSQSLICRDNGIIEN